MTRKGAVRRVLTASMATLLCASCTTYEGVLGAWFDDWRPADTQAAVGSPRRQATVHAALVTGNDGAGHEGAKVRSFSATDGKRIRLKPLKLLLTAEAPLATLRYYELKNDPPLSDIYRRSGEAHRRYVDALSKAITEVFGDSTRVNLDLVTVPSGRRLREVRESRVRNGAFNVRFYMPEVLEAWLARHRDDLKISSHEIFHAFDQLANRSFTGTQQLKALDETAASIFSKCVEIGAFGEASVYGDPAPARDGWKVGFTDAELIGVLSKDYEGAPPDRVKRRAMSEMFAWSLWLHYVGARWEAPQGDAGIENFRLLCSREYLADRRALLGLLYEIASDGKDAPVFDLEASGEPR